jgi:hypothetical protein
MEQNRANILDGLGHIYDDGLSPRLHFPDCPELSTTRCVEPRIKRRIYLQLVDVLYIVIGASQCLYEL